MAGITDLAIEDALNISGAGTPYSLDAWLFQVGSKVWRLADLPADGSNLANTPSYTIRGVGFKPANDGSDNEQILDQRANAATPCDGSTSTSVQGFQHPAATVGNTTSRPWFYRVQNNVTNEILTDIHESQITGEVNWTTYLGTKLAAIIA